MTQRTIEPARGPLRGSITVPGDKSVSHRAVLFAAMAEGTSHLTSVLDAADVRSTIAAVRALGATLEIAPGHDGLAVTVAGWGPEGPREPAGPIDCGNSGTTARLLMGVLAGWPGRTFTLTGDSSLSKRPMRRVLDPLAGMGADTDSPTGTLPVTIRGARLRGIDYTLPVASAQVKSAVLLAGVHAEGDTVVREPAPSRDHTERLLPAFGIGVACTDEPRTCTVAGGTVPRASDVIVPGDPSSAAFIIGAALVVPDSSVAIAGVSLNPTRIGFLRVLERMGARALIRPALTASVEPVGDIIAGFRALEATHVTAEEVPSLIDEVPLLAVVATQAFGKMRFDGVAELRVKESDRLAALADALAGLGAQVRAGDDWLEVTGPTRLHGDWLDSLGDHRLAMAYSVAALIAETPLTISGYDAIAVSYPGFTEALTSLMVS
ncbi:MAG TPA: 3-phosphoshikimate 1-carboxyvinyltransferase [Coriobacteriia bacterium]